jgi:hypothetical protein
MDKKVQGCYGIFELVLRFGAYQDSTRSFIMNLNEESASVFLTVALEDRHCITFGGVMSTVVAFATLGLLTLFSFYCLIFFCKKSQACCYKRKPEKASARMRIERELAIHRE